MRVLDLIPDRLRVSVKDSTGHPFNFAPRFVDVVYPDKTVSAKDTGIIAVGAGKTVEASIEFPQKLRIERFLMMDLRYARKKIATIEVE